MTLRNAFSSGLSRSIRPRYSSTSSRDETSPARTSSACRATPANASSSRSMPGPQSTAIAPARPFRDRRKVLCVRRLAVNVRAMEMNVNFLDTPGDGGANRRSILMFPDESSEYRAARDRLLEREIELRKAMEEVAAARRALPRGGPVPEDYVFQGAGPDGEHTDVRLSELFEPGKDSLAIYSFMFPRDPGDDRPGPTSGRSASLPLAEGPCPSCVALLDQLDGAVEHAPQHLNLAVVARAPLARLLTFAEERGWRRLRLLSS